MGSFCENMDEYQKQMQKGVVSAAYKGLMEYIMDLRVYFKNKYPDHYVSGSIYPGLMDMTFFSFNPKPLKDRNLKVLIFFVHETFNFEVWLAAVNKQVQEEYWKMIKESGWNKFQLVPDVKGNDAILKHVCVEDPDFGDLDELTRKIEKGTLKFIKDVESFLSV